MQWQHGKYVVNSSGNLTLTPIALDGRQLTSAPCLAKKAVYAHYNQSETFEVGPHSTSAAAWQ